MLNTERPASWPYLGARAPPLAEPIGRTLRSGVVHVGYGFINKLGKRKINAGTSYYGNCSTIAGMEWSEAPKVPTCVVLAAGRLGRPCSKRRARKCSMRAKPTQ